MERSALTAVAKPDTATTLMGAMDNAAQLSFHDAPIFRLLLKIAVF